LKRLRRADRLPLATTLALLLTLTSSCTSQDWASTGAGILDALETQRLSPGEITLDDMAGAFKDALRIGSGNVTGNLGQVDGFNADPVIRILLPDDFGRAEKLLRTAGFGRLVDDFGIKLNRAAERAAPLARDVFWQAIKEMTFSDVRAIYEGPDNAATLYFQERTTDALRSKMRPIVDDSLSRVGAIDSYERVMGRYKSLPLVPDVKADLTGHVVDGTLDGIFHYLAKEEAAIRRDPVRHTTALLKKVFGNQH